MRVTLLTHTPNPEATVAAAAAQCYSAGTAREWLDTKASPARVADLINKVLGNGHLSVFEHASFTFGVEGISRACSHQLVRFRVASFSQQSQRYVKGPFEHVIPPSIQNGARTLEFYEDFMQTANDVYEALLAEGIPSEDARFVLPNATETHLVMTMNARELLHCFNLRCCTHAQWEIRALAAEMLAIVKPVAPLLFQKAGPSCAALGRCPEGLRSCGKAEAVQP